MNVVKIVSGPAAKDVRWPEGDSADRVPARYDFNDGLVQQEIAGCNVVERSSTYWSVAPTMGIASYNATMGGRSITNDPARSYFEWSRVPEITDGVDPEAVEAIITMMSKQSDSVRDHFAQTVK